MQRVTQMCEWWLRMFGRQFERGERALLTTVRQHRAFIFTATPVFPS